MHDITQQEQWKRLAAEAATELIEPGVVVGLGTGTTAAYMIRALARRMQEGLQIVGAVPTSEASEQLARGLGIPLTDLDAHPLLDMAIDGADEVDDHLNLIKGGGGALLREKIVASAARRFIVIADVSKRVRRLGLKAALPIEVIPFAVTPISRRLEALGAVVRIRQRTRPEPQAEMLPYLTDNGNMILDCAFAGGIADAVELEAQLRRIVGIVETGLFLGMAQQVFVGGPQGVMLIPSP